MVGHRQAGRVVDDAASCTGTDRGRRIDPDDAGPERFDEFGSTEIGRD